MTTITVGTRVRWTSQAGGFAKTKEGLVVYVIPPKEYVREILQRNDRFRREVRDFSIFLRDHESYVVRVGKRLYWPIVKGLEIVE